MANPTPKIDSRSSKDIARQVETLLKLYATGWNETDPVSNVSTGFSGAMINIFSRFAELIIQRLNQVPDKNYLAFLNLIGASLLPPQPARVPLTFSPATTDSPIAVVPAGTQVASPPTEGETDPVIFETERELVVTGAQLNSIYVVDPSQDKYADLRSALTPESVSGHLLFQGNRPNPHLLYLGHGKLLGYPSIAGLRLGFIADRPLGDGGRLEWEIRDGTAWITKAPAGSGHLDQFGENVVEFDSLSPIAESPIDSIRNRWIRCRLITPITPGGIALSGMVRQSQLPELRRVWMEVHLLHPAQPGLQPEMAFYNTEPLDLGKYYFPFGENPKRNDSFYLSSEEAFSKDRAGGLADSGAAIELAVEMANSHLIPEASSGWPSEDLELAWECWDGEGWVKVGTSFSPDWLSLLELDKVPPVVTNPNQEQSQIVVQGTAQKSVSMEISSISMQFSQTMVVAKDRRFAITVPLSPGLNVISCKAQSRRRASIAWAVVFMQTRELKQTIQMEIRNLPDQPLSSEQKEIRLDIRINGPGAGLIKTIRVTNGNAPFQQSTQWIVGQDPKPVPLVVGRNELLFEGLMDNQITGAAITACVGRQAIQPSPDQVTGFSDGSHAFCQSGTIRLKLPDTVMQTTVNGQPGYWLRTRLINGDFGSEAGYSLKDPTDPSQGYFLTLAMFRPPMVSKIRIGYQQTLMDLPESFLSFNNLEFNDLTLINKMGQSAFRPFFPLPDPKPTVYFGFQLPSDQVSFPNRTISLFCRMAEFKYGEKLVPISPLYQKTGGTSDSMVSHWFYMTNRLSSPTKYRLSTYGTIWSTVVEPGELEIGSGEIAAVQVQVTIPAGTLVGSRDIGFVKVIIADDPDHEYTATFTTVVGTEPSGKNKLDLTWEYRNDKGWSELRVRDETQNFIHSGIIEFLAPSDFSSHKKFGSDHYWLRVARDSGQFPFPPRLLRVLNNTTMASQTITLRNQLIGSSDGSENQRFRTTRYPVLSGQQLEIREPEHPSQDEQLTIEKEEGTDAVTILRDEGGNPREIWVRWHEVPDFYGSGPRDRHYLMDHITGEIRFGNGIYGLIPPAGNGNIHMRRYKTGGGKIGNRASNTIVQLKTTVPYVGRVTNTEPAVGGADAENFSLLPERISRSLRHRGRAVTRVDFEDLAMVASPEVSRALCVPLYNLAMDPDATRFKPGIVSLVIVPDSIEAKPVPTQRLIELVRNYLHNHIIPTVQLIIVGAEYIRVDVESEIAITRPEGAGEVRRNVNNALSGFLHPLTGGHDGNGWDFGRRPYQSDLYSLIESIAGVDHVRSLKVTETEERPGVQQTGRYLVYSGTHKIRLTFTDT